jgi:hypothetical protein
MDFYETGDQGLVPFSCMKFGPVIVKLRFENDSFIRMKMGSRHREIMIRPVQNERHGR